jgi:hypothetical protein
MPELAFVVPETAAGSVVEFATALSHEVGSQDAASLVCAGFPEPRSDRVYITIDAVEKKGCGPEASRLSRTISILLAPPGSKRFDAGAELARRSGVAFHVNLPATERLLDIGVQARHLQLGYSPVWEEASPAAAPEPLTTIRDSGGYFDWVRSLCAIHRGAVVLHEQSLGLAPLLPGRHLFVAAPSALDAVAGALLEDPQRLDFVRRESLDFLRGALPLALAAAALIGAARALVAQPLGAATPGQPVLRSK